MRRIKTAGCSFAALGWNAWRELWAGTGSFTRVLLAFQLVTVPLAVVQDAPRLALDGLFVVRLLLTVLSIHCLGVLVTSLTPNWRWMRSGVPILALVAYLLLAFYHQEASIPFSLTLVGDNYRDAFAGGVLAVVRDRLAAWQWVALAAIYLCVVGWEGRVGSFAADVRCPCRWTRVAACALGYCLIVLFPVASFDEISLALRSLHQQQRWRKIEVPGGTHPYVTWRDTRPGPAAAELPNVFLIMIESFNAGFVERMSRTGEPFTPFFNSMIARGVYVERFYGNSVYTVKGQEATLGSIFPSLRGSLARDYPGLRIKGLPQILRERGYATLFAQAAPELAFHNTGPFMRRLGFEWIQSMHPESLDEEARAHQWGWGLQDDWFYRETFRRLDAAQTRARSRRPWFVTLATISTHAPFDALPAEQRRIFSQPADKAEHYANSLRAMDGYLREFFVQLQARSYLTNSIVILLGDHGHPAGEHGNFMTEVGCLEENFRTPFLLLWENRLAPRRIRGCAYSQIDVAPTILDLLNVSGWHHFQGRSILEEPAPDQGALLVQPYGGQLVAAVRYPYKYVLRVATNEEQLFNLAADPSETSDLSLRERDRLAPLRRHVEHLFANQRLIEENRIWPGRGESGAEIRDQRSEVRGREQVN